jgi:hypothetical protein
MREQRRILVSDIVPDPEQPRKHFDDEELLALGENMLAQDQLLPLLVLEIEVDEKEGGAK